jgi:hypothetical protein
MDNLLGRVVLELLRIGFSAEPCVSNNSMVCLQNKLGYRIYVDVRSTEINIAGYKVSSRCLNEFITNENEIPNLIDKVKDTYKIIIYGEKIRLIPKVSIKETEQLNEGVDNKKRKK